MCGKPLIRWTTEAVDKSLLDYAVVSTDDERMANGYPWVYRPPELAQDYTPMLPVIQHAVRDFELPFAPKVDAVMILQPTSPLRTRADINRAIELFKASDCDSLVSVTEGIHPIKSYVNGKPFLPQEPYDKHKHQCLTRNGAIFITRRDLLDSGRIIGDNPLFYVMPKERSIDIDDFSDLYICECILKNRALRGCYENKNM